MIAPLHTLWSAGRRLFPGGCVAALLGFVLLSGVAGSLQAAPVHEPVANFSGAIRTPMWGELAAGPDGYFWGTTFDGGAAGVGSIYKVKSDGTDWRIVLSFLGSGSVVGFRPYSGLTYDGAGYFWGTTYQGGSANLGTVFKVNVATGALTTVVEFKNGAEGGAKGANPFAALTSDGAGFFWGTTVNGGTANVGTVFKVNASTGALTTVAEFTDAAAPTKGKQPFVALVNDGAGFLWGTTQYGGTEGHGTIFKVNIASGALTTVVNFTAALATTQGWLPTALTRDNATGLLWGTTYAGGPSNVGTIFKLTTAGVLTPVVSFTNNGASNRGSFPTGRLVGDGAGNFLGTTSGGGAGDFGTVFKVNAASGTLTTLTEFTNVGAVKGRVPYAGLLNAGGGDFWGTTSGGGAFDNGTVYRINSATGALTTAVEFIGGGANNRGFKPFSGLVSDASGNLWGVTEGGGATNNGTIYKVNPATGAVQTVAEFSGTGGANKGNAPYGTLVSDGAGFFWGTTAGGGASDFGTVFKVNAASGALTTVAEFTGAAGAVPGAVPYAGLVRDGAGFLWGTTRNGGASDFGTLFKVNISTGALTTVKAFTNTPAGLNGANPQAALAKDSAGNLWGTTTQGGAAGVGTIFKVDVAAGTPTTVLEFTGAGAVNRGAVPLGALAAGVDGNFLWGTTAGGGAASFGTIFKVNTVTGALTTVAEFTNTPAGVNGAQPVGALASDGAGSFWGTTFAGGAATCGTAFKVNESTGAVATMMEFTGTGPQANSGANPEFGPLLKHSDGHFYGTTALGGTGGLGTVFRLHIGATAQTQPATFVTSTGALLTGAVNPNGDGPLTVNIQYGTDPALNGATTVNMGTLPDGTDPSFVFKQPAGLAPHTTYYFRVVASNAGNAVPEQGAILSFTTLNTLPAASNATVSAVAGQAQTISLPFAATDADGDPVTLINVSTNGHLTLNNASGAAVTFTPDSGFTGATALTYTVSDGHGGTATGTITVNVGLGGPLLELLYSKGGVVPGAGAGPGPSGIDIPEGAAWYALYSPAINDAGDIVFLAKIKWPAGPSLKAGTAAVLFKRHVNTGDLEALQRVGDAAPGAGADLGVPAGAVISAIGAPQIAPDGSVLFLASIKGAGVSSANSKLLVWRSAGALPGSVPVARTGFGVIDVNDAPIFFGAQIKTISAYALTSGGSVALRGTLLAGSGSPAVTKLDDTFVASWKAGSGKARALLREGAATLGSTLKSFKTLVSGSGAAGMGRGWFVFDPNAGAAVLRAMGTFVDGTTRAIEINTTTGGGRILAGTGSAGQGQAGDISTQLKSLGLGAFSWGADEAGAFRATLTTKKSGVYALDGNGAVSPDAELGDLISALPGVTLGNVKDPVVSSDGLQQAWAGTLKGSGITSANNTALFSLGLTSESGGELALLAQEGTQAAGCPAGVVWKAFSSLAVIGGDGDGDGAIDYALAGDATPVIRGVLFTATLLRGAGGVDASNDMGLWATDRAGELRLLLREGQSVGGKTVKSFQVLKAASGAGGVTRSCNNRGEVVVLVSATDGTQHLLRIQLP